jgi:phosphoserine phosphatase
MEYVKEDIKTLYEQRKKFIEESNYIKAEEISKKISNYKSFQMKKQQRELAQKKESEQNNFEKSYSEELFLFKQRWSKIEEEFQNDIKLKIKELKKRQKLELNEFIKNITEREIKQKITPNYINLKKVEEELVKQERFLEAEQIKHQAEKVLKKENNLMEIEYQQKIKKQIQLFKNRQNEEMTKFIEDNNKDIYKIQKNKNEEYDKIINKYRAFKVEMMLRQKDEETRAKKMLQKAFRSGKRSMSQEIKSNSNYFK